MNLTVTTTNNNSKSLKVTFSNAILSGQEVIKHNS